MLADKTPLKEMYRYTRTESSILKYREAIRSRIIRIVEDNPVENAATAAVRPLTEEVLAELSELLQITEFRASRQRFLRAVGVLAKDKYRGEGTKTNVLALFEALIKLAEKGSLS